MGVLCLWHLMLMCKTIGKRLTKGRVLGYINDRDNNNNNNNNNNNLLFIMHKKHVNYDLLRITSTINSNI